MRFYTNVKVIGDYIYYRGYEDDIEIKEKIQYKPTLYVPSNKKTKYKTLDGRHLTPVNPGKIYDTRKFIDKYSEVDGFEYFGNANPLYQFISDIFPEETIEFDINKTRLYVLDIETTAENGSINSRTANEEIILITIQDYKTKVSFTWGSRPFTEKLENHLYFECENECELLQKFLEFWENNYPDIITGWNCIPLTSNIWTKNKIKKLKNISVQDELYDSKIIRLYPSSFKKGVEQKLANGAKIISSYDHIFPYFLCDPNVYTKLTPSHKNKSYPRDMKVKDAIECQDEKFVFVPLGKNKNEDNSLYSYDDCYLLGLIYTDGSLKNKNKISNGFTLYQSDLGFLNHIKVKYNINSSIVGPYKNCYQLHIPYKVLSNIRPIYNELKKDIDLELISSFSQKQFYMFLSGLLDGDGCFNGGKLTLCNYNNDILDLYELCLWNGIFSTIFCNEQKMNFIDIDFSKLDLKKFKRWNNGCTYKKLNRNSSQKAKDIKCKKVDGGYFVKVLEFNELDEMEMMDIETDTHYFISSGVKTHNCSNFDIPYIVHRICKNFGDNEAKRLSVWKRLNSRTYEVNGREEMEYDIYGISTLDYQQLFKKFAFENVENYRLNTVAEKILKEKKLDHEQYETFKDFYTKDFDLFVKYNVQDCNLVSRFEKKLCLIQLAFTLAYQAKVNLEDVYFQGRMWDGIIYNYLKRENIVIPCKKRTEEKLEKFKGAFVKEPLAGKFKYVCSFDLASLYPSLIRTYNISPETLVLERNNYVSIDSILEQQFEIKDEHKDYAICPNGSMYRKDIQGFLPKIMEKMFNERSVYKKKMLHSQSLNEKEPSEKLEEDISMYRNYQQALKICLNSAFGSLGNQYFRFYDIRNAEAITYSGQVVIRWIEKKLNTFLNKMAGTEDVDMIIAMDTDSVAGDSLIRVNGGLITISDFYNSVQSNYLKFDEFNNNYVKSVSGSVTLSVNLNGELEEKNIKYVMKHKVKKKLYEIKVKGRKIKVTEDHSIIVKNKKTNKIYSVKPQHLSPKNHFILYIIEPDTDSNATS